MEGRSELRKTSQYKNEVRKTLNYNVAVAALLGFGCCALLMSTGLFFILPEDEPFDVVDRIVAKSKGLDESFIDKMRTVNAIVYALRHMRLHLLVLGIVAAAVSVALYFRAGELRKQVLESLNGSVE